MICRIDTHSGGSCRHTVQAGHIFRQFYIELRSVRYNADISICQACRGTALDFQLFSQLFVNICARVSAEVQAFGNGIVNVCNICCINILLRFGCDICQGNLFLIAFFVRYGQHHISVAVRFVLALASCFRICYQMIIFLCHLGEYFAQVYIDFARIIPFQCQGLAVIGNAAACDIVVFESRYIGGQVVRTGQCSRAVAVCLVICSTACHILVFRRHNTVDIADIGRIGRRISAAGYVRDLLVPRVDAVFIDIGISVDGQAAVRSQVDIFFQVVFYGRYLSGRIFCHGSRCICSIGKVDFTAILHCIHIIAILLCCPGSIGCYRFQLGHIDGIGIIRAGRHIDDLAFYRIRADTDGACRSFCRLNGIYLCRVGTGRNVSIGCLLTVGNTVSAECYAAIYLGIGINTHGNGFFPLAACQRPDCRAGIAFRQSIEPHGHRSVTGGLAHRAECHGCRSDGSSLDIIGLIMQSSRTKRCITGRLIIQIFIIRQSRQKGLQFCTIQLDIIRTDRHGRVSDRPCVCADSHRLRSVSLCHAADSHALCITLFRRTIGMIYVFDPYIRLCAGTDCHIAPASVSIAVAADRHLSGTRQLVVFGSYGCCPVADSNVFIRLYAGFRTDSNRVIDGPLRRQLGNTFRAAGKSNRICISGFLQIAGFGGSTESDGIITACLGIITNGHNAFSIQLLISPGHKRICACRIFQGQRAGLTPDGQ